MPGTDAAVAYIDGGSRGNPGPAGVGVHIETPEGSLIEELRASVGTATNNVAEYRGLLAALTWALEHGCRRLHIRSDSQLLVCQMRGEYRVKNAGLQSLHREARELAARIGRVSFEHVPRARNQDADRLANLAMDEAAATPPAIERRIGAAKASQSALPFDEHLPDNAPHSGASPRTNRKPGRR